MCLIEQDLAKQGGNSELCSVLTCHRILCIRCLVPVHHVAQYFTCAIIILILPLIPELSQQEAQKNKKVERGSVLLDH